MPNTLVLFSEYLKDQSCFCLKINAEGMLTVPPAQRSFAEIRSLQDGAKTLIIETAINATLLDVELSWLSERKARAAIPYALEDKLAQPIEELHFAFDKALYENNHYLVAVISKQRIRYLIELLKEQDIKFSVISLDWFALNKDELCISGRSLLTHSDNFKGALTGELAIMYLKNHPNQQALVFSDSQIHHASKPKNSDSSYLWLAQRFTTAKLINLCQGEMQQGNKAVCIQKRYQLAFSLFCFWLLSLVLVNAANLYLLNSRIEKINAQIATIYQEFFPKATQIINPKFRITELTRNHNAQAQARFWFLLNQCAKVIKDDCCTLEQIHYQNKTLSLSLISKDFSSLEKLANDLRTLQITVKQTQAATREQGVTANLELR